MIPRASVSTLPIRRPESFPEEVWNRLKPGERVRTLRVNSDLVFLGVEIYEALARLPFWAFYGPEDGLPAEYFNDRGFWRKRKRFFANGAFTD